MTGKPGNIAAEQLDRAITDGTIPTAVKARAEAIRDRLNTPVRVTLIGLPGSGKSSLANLLLGSQVIDTDVRLPTIQIRRGDAAKAICTLPDGSTTDLAQFDPGEVAAQNPIFVEAELPLPALGKISLLEVVAPGSTVELSRALTWAASRTDITIWCSRTFGGVEMDIWDSASDDVKDHAFLLLTRADELAEAGQLQARMENLRAQVGDQFKDILPIATLQAIAARGADGSVDKDQMTKSGGRALIQAILREVDLGLQAATDQAEYLLQRYKPAQATQKAPVAAENAPEMVETPPQVPAEAVSDAPATSTPVAVVTLHPATRAAYEAAIDRLSRTGQQFAEELDRNGTLDAKRLMEETVNSVQWLCDYLSDNCPADDPSLARMRDTAFDAADLMQLMQMENAASATSDSLSVVIQLRREMEAGLAA